MLHIIVWGFPKTNLPLLQQCRAHLKNVPVLCDGVRIPEHYVTISFPTDQLSEGLGEELLAYVHDLERNPRYTATKEQKDHLCVLIGAVLKIHRPRNCKHIQVETCGSVGQDEGYFESSGL